MVKHTEYYHVTEAGLVEGESLGRISVVLKADYERMYEAVLFAEKCFNMISSRDGSGHGDLGRRVLSISGISEK